MSRTSHRPAASYRWGLRCRRARYPGGVETHTYMFLPSDTLRERMTPRRIRWQELGDDLTFGDVLALISSATVAVIVAWIFVVGLLAL